MAFMCITAANIRDVLIKQQTTALDEAVAAAHARLVMLARDQSVVEASMLTSDPSVDPPTAAPDYLVIEYAIEYAQWYVAKNRAGINVGESSAGVSYDPFVNKIKQCWEQVTLIERRLSQTVFTGFVSSGGDTAISYEIERA